MRHEKSATYKLQYMHRACRPLGQSQGEHRLLLHHCKSLGSAPVLRSRSPGCYSRATARSNVTRVKQDSTFGPPDQQQAIAGPRPRHDYKISHRGKHWLPTCFDVLTSCRAPYIRRPAAYQYTEEQAAATRHMPQGAGRKTPRSVSYRYYSRPSHSAAILICGCS